MVDRAKDTEQLLLLLSLAQVQDAPTVRRLFSESLAEMFPGHSFAIVEGGASESDGDSVMVPVGTSRRAFGALRVHPALDEEDAAVTVRNLTAMLGVLLENLAQRDELRRRAEQTEALLSNIVRKLPVLVYVYDPERHETVYQNAADPSDGEDRSPGWASQGPPHLTGRYGPDAEETVARHLERISAAGPGEVVSLEFSTTTETDGTRWLLTHDTPYAPEGDPRRYILGACVDVTTTRSQADALRETIAQRDVLLNEVHHRVKNNMQIIVSLLNLQEDALPLHEAGDVFAQVRNRVAAMALVHEQLYHSATLSAIDVRPYLSNLISTVRQSYERPDSPWHIRVSCDPLQLGLEQSIPFGLLVTELVSNAFKHADGPAPELHIAVRESGDGAVELRVCDNGPGMEADAARRGVGIGLTLVDSLVKQLEAEVARVVDRGTHWTIRFRVPT